MERQDTKKLEWAELWEAMDNNPEAWIDTTADMYDEMLGAVPPQDMFKNGFLVGEPNSHNSKGQAVYACFVEHAPIENETEKCYQTRYMTQEQFNAWKAVRR